MPCRPRTARRGSLGEPEVTKIDAKKKRRKGGGRKAQGRRGGGLREDGLAWLVRGVTLSPLA